MFKKPLDGILAAIGNTPLTELNHLMPDFGGRIYGKLEFFNPGGSIKDRSAAAMILDKIESGVLEPGRSVVVESSSGNLAIGLAQICRYFDLKLICVVDAMTTEQNLAILRAYDVGLDIVADPDPLTGEFLSVRKRRVRELVETTPHAYSPDQYSNPLNPRAHERTMAEIAAALDGRVDYLFVATSTTGTLTGCANYIRKHGLATTVVAVDAIGSVLYGSEPSRRLIPGHGASVAPYLLDRSLPDQVVHVSDLECVVGCRRLVHREAILAGGSSGATVAALEIVREQIADDANCVLIFPDGGDRYVDTVYSDTWVGGHFGEVAHLWKNDTQPQPGPAPVAHH